MSDLQIEQQDAAALAAGYRRSFRYLEIFAITSFWTLSLLMAWRAWAFVGTHGWVILAAVAAGFLWADFVSGFVHWMADTWGSADMPVLGKSLVRPFREHHVDPKAMTRHDYVETNGANCLVSLPVAAGIFLIPFDPGSRWFSFALFSFVCTGAMVFFVMWTNQIHKWSHLEPHEVSPVVRALQRLHLILPVDHHHVHHGAPYQTHYCITTGWLNWPLSKLRFHRHMERLVTAVLGLVPRQDDIGLKAALQLAPLVLTETQPDAQPQRS